MVNFSWKNQRTFWYLLIFCMDAKNQMGTLGNRNFFVEGG